MCYCHSILSPSLTSPTNTILSSTFDRASHTYFSTSQYKTTHFTSLRDVTPVCGGRAGTFDVMWTNKSFLHNTARTFLHISTKHDSPRSIGRHYHNMTPVFCSCAGAFDVFVGGRFGTYDVGLFVARFTYTASEPGAGSGGLAPLTFFVWGAQYDRVPHFWKMPPHIWVKSNAWN